MARRKKASPPKKCQERLRPKVIAYCRKYGDRSALGQRMCLHDTMYQLAEVCGGKKSKQKSIWPR